MENLSLKQKTAKGLFWGGFSSGMQQVVGLVFGIFLARLLNDEDYGLVAELSIFTGIASTIINCGFSTALTNKRNASHRDFNAVFWFSSLTGITLYIILFFAAPLIAQYYKEPALTALSRVLFLSFLIGGVSTASYTYMYKHLQTKQLAIIDTVSLLSGCTVGLILALNGFSYWALAVQILVYYGIAALLRFFVSPWKPSFAVDFSPLKPMFSFSYKILLTGIFSQINANIFSVIIGKMHGKDEAGIYSQGQKWAGMGSSFITTMISYVTQPVLAQINDDRKRQANALRKLIRFGAFVSFPLLLGFAFAGKEFIVIAIGEKWLESVPYLQLFCILYSFQFLTTLFSNLIFTQGKSDIYMSINIITGIVQLAVIAFLSQFGIFNMVIGYISVSLLSLFVWHYYVKKLSGLRLRNVLKDILPYLGISLLCIGITMFLTRNIENIYLLLALKIVITGTLYIFMLKICKSVIFKESIEFLRKIF
jgi:O-antigen/teichoic acid export membrane protein